MVLPIISGTKPKYVMPTSSHKRYRNKAISSSSNRKRQPQSGSNVTIKQKSPSIAFGCHPQMTMSGIGSSTAAVYSKNNFK